MAMALLLIGAFWGWRFLQPLGERDVPRAGPAVESEDAPSQGTTTNQVDLQTLEDLRQQREELDRTVYANEELAQEYERVFIELWDRLRGADDQWAVMSKFPLQQLVLGKPGSAVEKDWGIQQVAYSGEARTLSTTEVQQLIGDLKSQGVELIQSEWHHETFKPENPDAIESHVRMTLHLADQGERRWIVKGTIVVHWAPRADDKAAPLPHKIDATNVKVTHYEGPAAFTSAYRISPEESTEFERIVMPVSAYDLDKNGLSDIILPGINEVHYNRGEWRFEVEPLMEFPAKEPSATVLGDFNGDGRVDLIAAARKYMALYIADDEGKFTSAPVMVDDFDEPLVNPMTIAAGDVDGDGDLDVWFGQYKRAYVAGQMATPYYDANDGYPAHLLLNNGLGKFTNATQSAGLDAKRFRRTYSSALVDLDGDRDLDLVVCSDFAGLDVYLNNGRAEFTDVSDSFVDQTKSFGMSLTFGDYNSDGRCDFFMTGMGSTTARRLQSLNCNRDEFPEHNRMRQAMGYGNRLYLAEEEGFRQAPYNDQVARTGWAWGATTQDFDNDGDDDMYVANGHVSRESAQDYCTKFWRHDIYTGSSQPNPTVKALFQESLFGTPGVSWNGFEHNCLLLNHGGEGFDNIGFLAGVGFEFDSRSVIGDDFDGDGRVDLLVFESSILSPRPYDIHLLRNQLPTSGHWIGIRLQEDGSKVSPLGATVRLKAAGLRKEKKLVCGDSFSCQHATTLHFGLGEVERIDEVEILWSNGARQVLQGPAVDRYHLVDTPSPPKAAP